MATLTGTTIQSTYDSLLKVSDNDAITSTLKRITDGLGNNTPLYLSSSAVEISSGLSVIGSITGSNISGSNTGDETKSSIETKLGAATASNSGFLTSTDWSTFNNKVAGSGTLNAIPKFTSASSIGNSSITDNGTIVTINEDVNISGGALGIGSSSLTEWNLRVSKNIVGAGGNAFGIGQDSQIQSSATSNAFIYYSIPTTQATSFTLANLYHYAARQGSLGAGSAITNQYGFWVESSLTGATNNYGFFGNIGAGTNRWNLFMQGTANNHLAGSLGIGSTSLAGISLRASRTITGAVNPFGILQDGVVQSDANNNVSSFGSVLNTQAAAFTIANYFHYSTAQGTIGAGSSVTNQMGFRVSSGMIGATNNFAFYGDLGLATGRWNLYMNGQARNYLNGSLSIGSTFDVTASTGFNPLLKIASTSSGAIFQNPENNTNNNNLYFTKTRSGIIGDYSVAVQANDGLMFLGGEGSDGAGALRRAATIIMSADGNFSATSAPGRIVFGTTPSGSVTVSERMRIDSNGAVGIGTTSLAGFNLRVDKAITGAVTSFGISVGGAIQSDVTTSCNIYNTGITTQAAAFTLPVLRHYTTSQGTIGAGSSVTTQVGFNVAASLIGATNNYGFFGDLAAGTGRFNLYMNGTANNYLAGSLGIGSTALVGYNVRMQKTITGATTAWGMAIESSIQSDVTGTTRIFSSNPTTQATAFTLTNLYHYAASSQTLGAGSVVTTQAGFFAGSGLTTATNNYGFQGDIPSGTNRFNLYMSGTARNYLAGALNIGSTTDNGTGAVLQVTGGITYQNIFNRRSNNYTLVLTDQNDIVEMNIDVTANTVTVPTDASVAFPIGTEILIMRYGSGITEIVPSAGVTIRSKASFRKIADQYTGATLVKVGTNEWYLVGNLTA